VESFVTRNTRLGYYNRFPPISIDLVNGRSANIRRYGYGSRDGGVSDRSASYRNTLTWRCCYKLGLAPASSRANDFSAGPVFCHVSRVLCVAQRQLIDCPPSALWDSSRKAFSTPITVAS
jgi:hypothetical protein